MKVEPGQKFTITYGADHPIEVIALTARQKRGLVGIIKAIQQLDTRTVDALEVMYDLAEQGVKICCPDITEEQLSSMDENQQLEIVGKTIAGALLAAGEQKKSESPHCSDAANCANPAEEPVTT
jgi:hypothetical protein